MNILFAIEVIHPGGAETFVLRLADAFRKSGHHVVVFVFYKEHSNKELHQAIAPEVTVIYAHINNRWLLQKTDSLLFKLKIDKSLRKKLLISKMMAVIKEHAINIIHSNLLKADTISIEAGHNTNTPVIATIHGDYLQYFTKIKKGIPVYLLNYFAKAKSNLQKLKQIVCISDKQLSFFNENFASETNGKLNKIYNGYPKANISTNNTFRQDLGIKESDFVFGMISRGIPEKGWQLAIEAFQNLNNEHTHLVLVGASNYMKDLEKKYQSSNIHFIGHSNEPLNWLYIFDAGLLPSTYASESLPTVVIEYLACCKPVIASDAGEINNMLNYNGKKSGITIPIKDSKISVQELSNAMQTYLSDKELYLNHKNNTSYCFEQFDMNKCIDQYMEVYQKAIRA